MPQTEIRFYRNDRGRAPVLDWLRALRWRNRRAFGRSIARIARLRSDGFELRRPVADYLRDGIHELRVRDGHVQIRILYFFDGRSAVVLAHALVKEDLILAADIERALERKRAYEANPEAHTSEEVWDA